MGSEIVLIAGDPGRRGREPLLTAVLARLGPAHPNVAYVGAASNDNRVFFLWISALLKKAGAASVGLVPRTSRRAAAAGARTLLERSDIVFVSGGDVALGMRNLQASGMIQPLRELHRSGRPFVGLSAGSIMLARSWVRWADEEDDATAAAFSCLGLAPLLCDTHAEAEGWQELKMLLRLTGAAFGYGIPSGAALRIGGDGALSALGRPVQRIALGSNLPELKP